MKPSLVVLAAGLGSRYGGLKQIDPVGPSGETVLDYSVFDARRAGFGQVVFVIRREIEEAFRAAFGQRFEGFIDVRYAFQELSQVPEGVQVPPDRSKPWGTGHALLSAASQVAEPFAVVNADDFYGANSYKLLADFLRSPALAADENLYGMVGFRLDTTLSEHGTVARGLCQTDASGLLVSVEELTAIERTPEGVRHKEAEGKYRSLTGREIVSMNLWGFAPSIFPRLSRLFREFVQQRGGDIKAEFYIPAAVNALIQSREARVRVLQTPDSWFGITYRADRDRVVQSIRRLVEQGVYPENLWRGLPCDGCKG